MTSLIDAEPVTSTPSNLPPLQTGSFAVPLKSPEKSSNACLNSAQNNSWSCADGPSISLKIIDSGNRIPLVNVSSGIKPDFPRYGAQPPELVAPVTLTVMNDKNDRGKGPAYFFQQLYNKVVIIKEVELVHSGSKRSLTRGIEASNSIVEGGRRAGPKTEKIQPSDKPWYCIWNDTILEGFIYATQENDDAVGISAPLAPMSTFSDALASEVAATSASPLLATSTNGPLSATEEQRSKRQATGPPFPKRWKLEERRTVNSPQPYCKQMQLLDNYDLVPAADPPLVQPLDEVEPMQQNRLEYGGGSGRRRTPMEASSMNSQEKRSMTEPCQCVWVDD